MAKSPKSKSSILSGIQPTGTLHIGNYLGALKQFIELQKEHECYFMVADLHALTSNPSHKELNEQTLNIIRTYLAAGLDPQKSTIFIQSQVHEHAELTWILSTLTSVGELQRMTQFKEKTEQGQSANVGLFTYPVLMAADVLLYQAQKVPVGDDQVQHLELTRNIARRFNKQYGQVFVEPKPLLTKQARVMALNDPEKKMSKSLSGSYISLIDSPATIRQKVMSAVTDSLPNPPAMSAGVTNLFLLADHFLTPAIVDQLRKQYNNGTLRYRSLKERLAEGIIEYLLPLQSKISAISDKEVLAVAQTGAKQAALVAADTLDKVKEAVGLI